MAKIHTLKISNYRGIQNFEYVFGLTDFVCLIGRGDSGKSTILQAISAVLSPSWNYSFYDTDFYNGNIDDPIIIEASLYDLPSGLLSKTKYGLHKRLLKNEQIIDDLTDEESSDNVDILTIQLKVAKDLEPKWDVINDRINQDSREMRANDRAKLNVFLVSDLFDRHFTWSKGNPLYSLWKQNSSVEETNDVIIDAFREAKEKVDDNSFSYLNDVIKKVENNASDLGLEISDTKTTIDFKDISIRDGRISLHADKVPFRLKGKGSKRLLSIAIQSELAKSGGIVLIDEIEQGLEPDRVRFLVNKLDKSKYGQIFITTHSNNVLVELSTKNLFLMRGGSEKLISFDEEFQGCLRNNSEAFFSKKVLICEGATEVGICRALNTYRVTNNKNNFAILGIGIVDGNGSKLVDYSKKFKQAGFDVCVFCDSDVEDLNNKKEELATLGITVVDCEQNNSIEQQLFIDLPWNEVQRLVSYIIEEKGEESIKDSVRSNNSNTIPNNWRSTENVNIRKALGISAKTGGWFKRIDHGEFIGDNWFQALDRLEGKILLSEFNALMKWINHA